MELKQKSPVKIFNKYIEIRYKEYLKGAFAIIATPTTIKRLKPIIRF